MSEYKGIRGFTVQTVSTDPAASVIATGTWSSGGALNTARQALGSQGTQTAALAAGGSNASKVANVEIYDGSSWTEVADINLARNFIFGFGTTTAGLVTGGLPASFPPFSTANTETWNGTAWTEVNDLNTARGAGASATSSPNTAGLIAGGGYVGPTAANTNVVESWNGTSWTEVADLNTTRSFLSGLGIQTAALATGGSPITGVTEQWNGSSWTEVSDLNTSRRNAGTSGLYTDGLAFGGDTDPGWISATEHFDGTSWTELNDLSIARRTNGCGTSPTALAIGGANDSYISATEEWNVSPPASFSQLNLGQVYYNSTSNAFKVTRIVYGTGAWASGASMNVATSGTGTFGSQSSAVAFGGYTGSPTNDTETYDGTSWTETTEMSNARVDRAGMGSSSTDGYALGTLAPAPPTASVENWNGSTWTEVNDMNVPHQGGSAAGTPTSGLVFAGEGNTANTESWNGTSWTEVGTLNVGRGKTIGFGGSSTDAILANGFSNPPLVYYTNTEVWNGSTWTEVNNMIGFHQSGGSGGSSSTLGIGFGGDSQQPPGAVVTATTESWDGTSWTEVADLATARMDLNYGKVGTGRSSLAVGGDNLSPGITNVVEEWTIPSPTTNSTITVS
jgi:hypothetical protein